MNTVLLVAATTIMTLVIATIAGCSSPRRRFVGRGVLISLLTLPLSFPGVIVGFFVILLGGRRGLIPDHSARASACPGG